MTLSLDLSPQPEFSRPLEADSLAHGTTEKKLKASGEECAALKERLSIADLKQLTATLQLARSGSGRRLKVTVSGHLDATLVQICVLSLEPFETHITADFQTLFEASAGDQDENWDLDLQDDDPPEPILEGIIDLGELVAQSLSLEIDLHPRKPGAVSDQTMQGQTNHLEKNEDEQIPNPFAVLKNLKFDAEE